MSDRKILEHGTLLSGAVAALVLTGFPDIAASQDVAGEAAQLEEIIVTASRRDERLQDTAMAVTVLDIEDFAAAGKFSLPELLPYVPGIAVQTSGGSFGSGVTIRGINAVLSGGVATYIDDIPYGSSTRYAAGAAPIDGVLLDLESLNVLKGPQGTLYGAFAMGGLLKFKTRSPDSENWNTRVSADLSDTSGGGLNQLYRLSANGPLGDRFGLSFTGFWNEKSGFIDNAAVPKNGWDDYEYYGGSTKLTWTPTENLDIQLTGLYQKSTQDGLATVQANSLDDFPIPGVSQGEPISGDRFITGDPAVNPSIFETSVIGLSANYEFDVATLTWVSSDQDRELSSTSDVTQQFGPFMDMLFPGNAPHTEVLAVLSNGWDKTTHEARLTSKDNESFEWIVGAFYQDEEGFNIQEAVSTPPEPTFFFADFPSTYEEKSLYATGTFYFRPNFDVSLGLRYSDYEQSVELDNRGTLLIAPLPFNVISDEVTTFLVNARYRPSDNLSVYGRIASGFRPGGANLLLLDPITGAPLVDPFFNSDDLVSYELGIKGSNGRFAYDVAAYFIDWSEFQIPVIRNGLGVSGNAEAASSTGIEAALSFAATDSFSLDATLSWIDAQLDSDEPDLGGANGDQLPNSPEWSGTLSARYDFDIGNLPFYLAGSYRYNGSFPISYPGYTDGGGMFIPPSAPYMVNDSYSVVDLRTGFSTERFEVTVYATNLLDDDDWVNFNTSFNAFGTGNPLRPRTIGVVLSAYFD